MGGPLGEERLLTVTHYGESSKKAWKVTMVGMECNGATF